MTTYETTTAGLSGLADLKRAHRKTWASGNYATVAERLIDDVPPRHLLERAAVQPGMKVLDLAAGTGNVAIRAAQLGARVTALDLTPELFDRGGERALEAGVEVQWVEGDLEDLPFEDGSFDRVLSTFGIQFAPRHAVAASEAVRVTRPGGLIGLVNWTPQGHIGRVLKAVGGRLPKPPDYASPPPLWGDEAHVRELLEPHGLEVEFDRDVNMFEFDGTEEDYFAWSEERLPPLVMAKTGLADRWDEIRRTLIELFESQNEGENPPVRIPSEYLVTIARKPG